MPNPSYRWKPAISSLFPHHQLLHLRQLVTFKKALNFLLEFNDSLQTLQHCAILLSDTMNTNLTRDIGLLCSCIQEWSIPHDLCLRPIRDRVGISGIALITTAGVGSIILNGKTQTLMHFEASHYQPQGPICQISWWLRNLNRAIHFWRPQETRVFDLLPCPHEPDPLPLEDVHMPSTWNKHCSLETASTMTFRT